MKVTEVLSSSLLVAAASAQLPGYAQCGGAGYTGDTTCVAGYSCSSMDMYYSQCMPGAAADAPSSTMSYALPTSYVSTSILPTPTSVYSVPTPTSVYSAPTPPSTGTLPGYAQCGGAGYSGATSCMAGYTCSTMDMYYSQCMPVAGSDVPSSTMSYGLPTSYVSTSILPTPTSIYSVPTPTSIYSVPAPTSIYSAPTSIYSVPTTLSSVTVPVPTAAALGWKWLGVDESGAEFGTGKYPGVYNKDFTFASLSSLDTLMSQGFNIFRLPFAMERMALNGVAGPISQAYLANYSVAVNHITSKGGYAIVDPHNFGRYNGAIITDVGSFQTFWHNVASAFKGNKNAIFDTNNEYHDMDQTLVLNLNQAAINGIRGAGATSQYIFAEGNSYSGAWTWEKVNDNLKALVDPQNKLVYEMHQYLDSDGSGTSAACVSGTIGAERIASATQWLKRNKKNGIIGEFAGGANAQCMSAVKGMLSAMKANMDVWHGAIWWGGGPWWGPYIYGFEPPSSTAYNYYHSTLASYKPS